MSEIQILKIILKLVGSGCRVLILQKFSKIIFQNSHKRQSTGRRIVPYLNPIEIIWGLIKYRV
jgi:hypothetical protein